MPKKSDPKGLQYTTPGDNPALVDMEVLRSLILEVVTFLVNPRLGKKMELGYKQLYEGSAS